MLCSPKRGGNKDIYNSQIAGTSHRPDRPVVTAKPQQKTKSSKRRQPKRKLGDSKNSKPVDQPASVRIEEVIESPVEEEQDKGGDMCEVCLLDDDRGFFWVRCDTKVSTMVSLRMPAPHSTTWCWTLCMCNKQECEDDEVSDK